MWARRARWAAAAATQQSCTLEVCALGRWAYTLACLPVLMKCLGLALPHWRAGCCSDSGACLLELQSSFNEEASSWAAETLSLNLLCYIIVQDSHLATTELDITKKDITPMGGFPQYGVIKEDYLMLKVGVLLMVQISVASQRRSCPSVCSFCACSNPCAATCIFCAMATCEQSLLRLQCVMLAIVHRHISLAKDCLMNLVAPAGRLPWH